MCNSMKIFIYLMRANVKGDMQLFKYRIWYLSLGSGILFSKYLPWTPRNDINFTGIDWSEKQFITYVIFFFLQILKQQRMKVKTNFRPKKIVGRLRTRLCTQVNTWFTCYINFGFIICGSIYYFCFCVLLISSFHCNNIYRHKIIRNQKNGLKD